MSIVLRELKINGSNVVDEKTTVDKLVIDVSRGLSVNLLRDVLAIEKNYPKLLKKIVIRNNGTRSGDVIELLSQISKFEHLPGSGNTKPKLRINELEIESKVKGDFIIDTDPFKSFDLKRLHLNYTNTSDLAMIGVLGSGMNIKKLSLTGFDLSSLDLKQFGCHDLVINERFANINRIQSANRLNGLTVANCSGPDFRRALDYVKTNKNIASLRVDNVDLSTIDIFKELKDTEVVDLVLNSNKLKSLRGAEQLFLTHFVVSGNDIGIYDIPTINKCLDKNPRLCASFKTDNRKLNSGLTYLQGGKKLTEKTLQRIRESEFMAPDEEVKDPLRHLVGRPLTTYSIKDAEIVRGKAAITHNAMEFDSDLDIETYDFEKSYLKGGTLLLTVEQAEKLAKSGRKIPMKIGIGIENASELSVEKLGELVKSIGVSEVRMVGTDTEFTSKYPYTPAQYRIAREKLDEVVSGIDPKESDLDKFATIYTRLAHMVYDYDAAGTDTRTKLLRANELLYDARTMVNGLRDKNTCVCSGYSEILRNAAALVGIKARYIYGIVDESAHAWTEVELADENGKKKKYWADLTWDAMENWRALGRKDPYDFKYFLIGEKEFREQHESYLNKGVEKNHEEYDRTKVREAIDKAKKRDIYGRNEKALILDPRVILPPKPAPKPEEPKKEEPKKEEPKPEEPKKEEPKKEEPKPEEPKKEEPKPEEPKPDPKPDPKPKSYNFTVGEDISNILADIRRLIKECDDIYRDSVARNPDTVGYTKPQPLRLRDEANKDLSKPPVKKEGEPSKKPGESSPRERYIDDDDEER